MSAPRAVAVLTILLLAGCASTRVSLNSATIPPQGGFERTVIAKACGMQFTYIIPIMLNSRHERAYESLKAQAGSDLLTAIEVQESWTYAFVGTVYCTTLRARAVAPYPAKAPAPPPPPPPEFPAPVPGLPAAEAPAAPAPDATATPPAALPAAATTPPAAVPADVPAPPTAPAAMAPGGKAKVRAGGIARARALADGAPVSAIVPGTVVDLKVVMTNAAGKWWYVTAASGSGWILESELESPGP